MELRELAAAVLAKLAHEHEDNQSDAWQQLRHGKGPPEAMTAAGSQGHRGSDRSSAQIVGPSVGVEKIARPGLQQCKSWEST